MLTDHIPFEGEQYVSIFINEVSAFTFILFVLYVSPIVPTWRVVTLCYRIIGPIVLPTLILQILVLSRWKKSKSLCLKD